VQVYRTEALTRTISTTHEARRPAFKPSPSLLSATRRVVCSVALAFANESRKPRHCCASPSRGSGRRLNPIPWTPPRARWRCL
jgi:hypothetical protein